MKLTDVGRGSAASTKGFNLELVSACAFVFLSACLLLSVPFQVAELVSSVHLSSRYRSLKASDFPYAIGAGMLILSVSYLIGILRSGAAKTIEKLSPESLVKIVAVYALLVGYVVLFRFFGFVISSAVFLGVTTLFLGNRKPLSIMCLAVVTPTAIYLCLNKLLLISLP